MPRKDSRWEFLKDLTRLHQYLDVALPYCTDEDAVYQAVRRFYQRRDNKPTKAGMRDSVKAHVAEVKIRKQQRLTYEQFHRHTTI